MRLLAGLIGLLAVPAGATAASVRFDRACYATGQKGTVTLTGFTPGVTVRLASNLLAATDVVVDASGASVQQFAESGTRFTRPGTKRFEVTATPADGTPVATASSRLTEYFFQTTKGRKPPKVKRTWRFSGFTTGQPIFGHFRLAHRLVGSYRFGIAEGPCGLLTVQAASLPIRGHVAAGRYKIQVDQERRYAKTTRPRLRTTSVVFGYGRPLPAAVALLDPY